MKRKINKVRNICIPSLTHNKLWSSNLWGNQSSKLAADEGGVHDGCLNEARSKSDNGWVCLYFFTLCPQVNFQVRVSLLLEKDTASLPGIIPNPNLLSLQYFNIWSRIVPGSKLLRNYYLSGHVRAHLSSCRTRFVLRANFNLVSHFVSRRCKG
jgi:hypothetical protein